MNRSQRNCYNVKKIERGEKKRIVKILVPTIESKQIACMDGVKIGGQEILNSKDINLLTKYISS